MDCFISYHHASRAFLDRTLIPLLAKHQVKAWTDENIPPGAVWLQWVLDKIKSGDLLIVHLSSEYQESLNTQTGACYGEFIRMVEHIETAILPGRLVVLWEQGELPAIIKLRNAIDIRTGIERLEERLLQAITEEHAKSGRQRSESNGTGNLEQLLPPPILRPQIRSPEDLPGLGRYNFDKVARRYFQSLQSSESMQKKNATALLRLLQKQVKNKMIARKADSWLDVGCGAGLVLSVACDQEADHNCRWLAEAKVKAAFDWSPRMTKLASLNGSYTHVFDLDVRDLTANILQEHINLPQVDVILANNVFHWLFHEKEIERAMKACRNVLRAGGILAASIAAVGTARRYVDAYHDEVVKALSENHRKIWEHHLYNPIGLQRLDVLVDLARRNGWHVLHATLEYEPRLYQSTEHYVDIARAYGDEVFSAPFANLSEQEKEAIWKRIADTFKQSYTSVFGDSEYTHDQYMIYMILRLLS